MIQYRFFYRDKGKAFKLLTLDRPLSGETVHELAWDFQATVYPPSLDTERPLTSAQRDVERAAQTTARRGHKALKAKNPALWKETRDDLLRLLLGSRTPRWGSIRITLTKAGV